jgi:stearoyl-CoA desaturase (delta-9 desaturase)
MLKYTHNQLVRGLQVFNHLMLIVGLVFVYTTSQYNYLLISLCTWLFIGPMGIGVGFHRLLSHRSFKTNMFWERTVSIIGSLTTIGSPLAWVAIHRQHHRSCERVGDPHSPYLIGNFRAWFGLWDYVRLDLKLVRDMRKDKFQKFLHNHYVKIILLYCVILACINPWLIVFVYCIPACIVLHSTSSIIVIAHRHGYKTYDLKHDESRNSWIANILALGEGWHNNHHAKPYAWSNWEKWYEWDLPAMIIYCIKNDKTI